MGFWTRAETELLITISAGDPHRAHAESNWAFYATRLDRCEGFTCADDFRPADGGRFISGTLDLGAYNFLWLRRQMTDEQQQIFDTHAAELDLVVEQVQYSTEPGERQTLFLAEQTQPYWMTVETDAAIWLSRLDAHPYAVCVHEQRSGDWVGRRYKLPRHLLTIRRSKVTREITDEQRAELRERLARVRRAA